MKELLKMVSKFIKLAMSNPDQQSMSFYKIVDGREFRITIDAEEKQ